MDDIFNHIDVPPIDDPFFDDEHPFPTREELIKMGFSEYLAENIIDDRDHTYTREELFHVFYESDNPVIAYNDMMTEKVELFIEKNDAFVRDLEERGLLDSVKDVQPDSDDVLRYNDNTRPENLIVEQKVGLADCWPACKVLTGSVTNNANWGFNA